MIQSTRRRMGFAGMFVLLALGVGIYWHRAAQRMEVSSIVEPRPVKQKPRMQPENMAESVSRYDTQLSAWQGTVLERPLFSQTRRPDAAPGAAISLRLTAIVVSNGRRKAIFMTQEGGRGVVADVGTTIGAWRVVSIEKDSVKLQDANGLRVMKPDRIRSADSTSPNDDSNDNINADESGLSRFPPSHAGRPQ
ncbi:hypothetical protein ABUE34_14615 (plasmid) [Kozakia baliensis]|uniref:hypothetical protein n=1 Tax=Kozakia baliensis TaxID=153496 RepID=UPI00345B7560